MSAPDASGPSGRLDPAQAAFLERQNAEALRREPALAALRAAVLAHGGDAVVLAVDDADSPALLARGALRQPDARRSEPMRPRACHANASEYYLRDTARRKIVTGYYLMRDAREGEGVWRPHTWVEEEEAAGEQESAQKAQREKLAAAAARQVVAVLHACATRQEEDGTWVLRTLAKVIGNAAEHPTETKFRRLRCDLPAVARLLAVGPAEGLLSAIGFARSPDGYIVAQTPAPAQPPAAGPEAARLAVQDGVRLLDEAAEAGMAAAEARALVALGLGVPYSGGRGLPPPSRPSAAADAAPTTLVELTSPGGPAHAYFGVALEGERLQQFMLSNPPADRAMLQRLLDGHPARIAAQVLADLPFSRRCAVLLNGAPAGWLKLRAGEAGTFRVEDVSDADADFLRTVSYVVARFSDAARGARDVLSSRDLFRVFFVKIANGLAADEGASPDLG